MKKILLFVLFCVGSHFTKGQVYGGEITYTKIDDFTFLLNPTVYVFNSTASWDSLIINYGDGSQDTVAKISEILIDSTLISKLDYMGAHAYPGAGIYVISFSFPNRPDGILNINNGNSVNVPFYIEDTLFIHDPYLLPFDYSPTFSHFQTDITYDGISLIHNSALIDSDADSVTYELVVPSMAELYPVTNYVFPNEMPGGSGTFTINDAGLVVWTSPQFPGKYCIAIKATLWKYGWKMGTIIRDMIIVVNVINSVDEINAIGIPAQIFPNPATSSIGLKLTPEQSGFVTIWNYDGEKVREENINPNNSFIDIGKLFSGLYFVKINGSTIGKFIKQ